MHLKKSSPKLFFLLVAILFIVACSREQVSEQQLFSPDHNHLLLMHPTVGNIRTINHLISEGILPMPGNYRIVGVYHQSGSYDYLLSADYIRSQDLDHFVLYEADGLLRPDLLFGSNELSPVFRWLFEQSEGVFFMGGPDIPPAVYGHPTSLLTEITDNYRHYLELSFLFHLLGGYQDEDFAPLLDENPDYSILGICLGMQTMNVATGGTMVQDIPFELYGLATIEEVVALDRNLQHRNYHINLNEDPEVVRYSFHQVVPEEGSLMEQLAFMPGAKPYVLSSHHQAIKDIGKGFRVAAWCIDSLIPEAIGHEKYRNVIGIQFHPEVVSLYDKDAKIRFSAGQDTLSSYLDMYAGDLGGNFHKSFWKHIALAYPSRTRQ